MRKLAVVLSTAGALALTGIVLSGAAEARGGFRPGFAGGFVAGAVIGGLASSAYAWGPGYGYYGYYPGYVYGPGYYRGCPGQGYGEYYNCGAYAVPRYGAPAYYGYPYGPW